MPANDHDPKLLYHQFKAEAGPEFGWEYRKQEPGCSATSSGKPTGSRQGSRKRRSDRETVGSSGGSSGAPTAPVVTEPVS